MIKVNSQGYCYGIPNPLPMFKNGKETNHQYSILLVDSGNAHIQLLKKWLTNNGFSVTTVKDGSSAIDRFNHEMFDLVLTDIMVPGKNGNTIAHYIHTRNNDVAVVAITAFPFLATDSFDMVISEFREMEQLILSLQYAPHNKMRIISELNEEKRHLIHQLQEVRYGH